MITPQVIPLFYCSLFAIAYDYFPSDPLMLFYLYLYLYLCKGYCSFLHRLIKLLATILFTDA